MWKRGLRRAVTPLLEDARGFSTGTAVAQSAPAVATASSSSGGGFLSALFGGSRRSMVPMTEPFPGVVTPPVIPPPASRPKTEQTTLSNGFKVASEDSYGPTSCAALVVASGSQYENPAIAGASHILEYMAYKTTQNRTHFRIMQEINGMGANIVASASREQMYYSIDCLRSDLPAGIEILCDSVMNPKFQPWDVKDILETMKKDVENLKKNPQLVLGEALVAASYSGGLGCPLIASESTLSSITGEDLAQFHAENFKAPRMVLAVAGADHQDVLRWAEPMLATAVPGEKPMAPPSQYVGGEIRMPAASDPLTHVILAFESPGGWKDVKAAATMTVLLYMMGGGGSFSAGGPGKGMHSRLYLNVLTQHHWVQNFSAVNQAFDDRCLTGVYGCAAPQYAGRLVDIMCNEMQNLAKKVSEDELQRAKSAAIGQVLMTLESKAVAAEDIGRQILTYGHRKPAEEFIAQMTGVTASDITNMVGNMLKGPVSMASMGELSTVPRYADVAKRFV